MNPTLQQLTLIVLPALVIIAMFVGSRQWMRRQQDEAYARFRLLTVGMVLLGISIITMAISSWPADARTRGGIVVLLLLLGMVARQRFQLRKQIRTDARRHNA